MKGICPVLLSLTAACQDSSAPPRPASLDGVYTMCGEVAGYSGETIELKNGTFRYWFYSDVVMGEEPTYPLTGTYQVTDSTVTLNHPRIHRPTRTVAVVNGVQVLWRNDGLELWEKEQRIHPYAILLKTEGLTGDARPKERPSLESLMSARLKDRERKEHEERYNDVSAEARKILRARSQEGDPNLDAYKAELDRARRDPPPGLIAELVALMGRESPSRIEAMRTLDEIYGSSFLFKEQPSFLKSPESRKRGLQTLIEALSRAPDRDALEENLIVFLRVSGVRKMDLPIPETPLRIKLEAFPESGGSYGSEGTPADDVRWVKFMSRVIPACQKWMRTQVTQ